MVQPICWCHLQRCQSHVAPRLGGHSASHAKGVHRSTAAVFPMSACIRCTLSTATVHGWCFRAGNLHPNWRAQSKDVRIWRECDLAAPCILPSGTTVDPGNLVHSFFTRFGGMSFAPPFMSDFFYPYPTLPAEGEPGEFDRMVDRTEDSQWKEARTFFVRDTGDELLLNSEGRCGWWLHASRKIVSAGSFQDVLLQLSRVSL